MTASLQFSSVQSFTSFGFSPIRFTVNQEPACSQFESVARRWLRLLVGLVLSEDTVDQSPVRLGLRLRPERALLASSLQKQQVRHRDRSIQGCVSCLVCGCLVCVCVRECLCLLRLTFMCACCACCTVDWYRFRRDSVGAESWNGCGTVAGRISALASYWGMPNA